MTNTNYVRNILKQILDKESTDWKEVDAAISYYESRNDDEFKSAYDGYNGHPEDLIDYIFTNTINDLVVVIDKDTTLDIGEESTKLRKINKVIDDEIRFSLKDIYEDDMTEDKFFEIYDGDLCVSGAYDNGEIADRISDITGWLVSDVSYHLEYHGKAV